MINKQKSAGLAYLLEILLFPFGAGWFYLNRVAHAVIHLVFGIILGAISWRMGWLLILAIRLDAINDHGTYVSNLMNNAPIQFLILILYAIWFAIDMIALKDGIAETNQEIMEQDQNYMMRMSQMFGHNPQSPVPTSAATPVEQKVEPTTVQPTTQRKKQATSTMNNQLDSKAWAKVVQNEKQTEEYQKFQNAYYDITNHLENGKLKRSYQLLEDEDYATASQYFEELLIAGEDQSLVYLGRSLANLEIHSPEMMFLCGHMLKKDNNFQRGSRLEDEGHTIYELFNQLMQRAQKKYEAIVVYQSVEARKNMNYDQIIRELTPYKEELNSEIFSRLQQEREEMYNRSVKMQEEETHSIEYFTTLHSQYAWCGEYKDAPQRMKELTEQRMVFEAQQKKKNQRLWITIASSIAVLVVISVSGYFMYRNYEGSTSLNHLSVKERMAIEEFCKKNELNSKEFIWKKEKDSSKEFIYITYEPIQLFKDSPQEEGSSEIGRDQTIYINPKDKKE